MKIKGYAIYAIAGLGALVSISGCAPYYSKVVKSERVSSIPDRKYETIIRLDTPEGMPIKPDAGFVYVEPGGKVTTDFPREVFVKTLDRLDKYEQQNRNNMGKYVIKDSNGKVRGYYEILTEYRAFTWEGEDDNVLLQIVSPNNRGRNNDGVGGPGGVGAGGIPGGGGK
jgi:hypothetical protein